MVRNILGHAQALSDDVMFPAAVLAWETFRKVTLIAPRVASETSKVLMVKSWTSDWDVIRSIPGVSLPLPYGRTERDEYDACVGK